MATFYPLESHGRFEVVEIPGASRADPPTRFLHCQVETATTLEPLEPSPGTVHPAIPVALAADDQFVLRGLLAELAVTHPDRQLRAGKQHVRIWRSRDAG